MKTNKPFLLFITAITLFSCGEKTRDWKNDFLGAWTATTPQGKFFEEWKKEKNALSGVGYEMNPEGDTVFYEKLELLERGEKLIYVAYPGGQRRTEFVGKRNEEGRYIFENPANDFPSLIEYIFEKNKVRVNLEGKQDGKKFSETLKMVKEK
jgi:hypothetical protein